MFTGFDANTAIVDFFGNHASALPEIYRNHLRDTIAGRDLLRTIIVTMETLYAVRGEEGFPEPGLNLTKELALFVEQNNFYAMADRARELITVVDRILAGGEAVLEDDPSPSGDFIPQTP